MIRERCWDRCLVACAAVGDAVAEPLTVIEAEAAAAVEDIPLPLFLVPLPMEREESIVSNVQPAGK